MPSVLIPDSLIVKVRKHGNKWPSGVERGGILLGYRKAEAIQLTELTLPKSWDIGSPSRFHRSERGHRVAALREWVRSDHTIDWVGEWHTHPGGFASPSSVDRQTWKKLSRHTGSSMVFVIFAGNQTYVGVQNPNDSVVWDLVFTEAGQAARLYTSKRGEADGSS